MFRPQLFDAYIRDGLTGQARPIARAQIAPYLAIFVETGLSLETGPVLFSDYESPVYLKLSHRSDRGELLPDGIEGRELERKNNMVKVWFEKRGVYIVHENYALSQRAWGAA